MMGIIMVDTKMMSTGTHMGEKNIMDMRMGTAMTMVTGTITTTTPTPMPTIRWAR